LAFGALGGSERAAAKLSTNLRVRTSTGTITTVADTMLFPLPGSPSVGMWVSGQGRVRVQGVPVVSTNSFGLAGSPPNMTTPMLAVSGDGRVRTG
jgi:hypothetical protein